jgi:hypothetical protein
MGSARYSGATIKKLAKERGAKLTRTQTAAQAKAAIIKKYGKIEDTKTYAHRGNGNWAIHSPKRDALRRPKKGIRKGKKAQKKFGSPVVKKVRNASGKVVGTARGYNTHMADTKRTKKTYKKGNRKVRGSV